MKRFSLLLSLLLALSCKSETPAPEGTAGFSQEKTTTNSAESPSESEGATLKVGSKLPSLVLSDLDGSTTDLASLKDKVTLVNIWATWCGPCRVEIPELIAIHREMKDEGVQVIGVSVDAEGTEADVKSFAEEQGINYPMLLDPKGELAMNFDASVIPLSILVDRKGKIVWVHYGVVERENDVFKQRLAAALAS